jgi:hypothetical protein
MKKSNGFKNYCGIKYNEEDIRKEVNESSITFLDIYKLKGSKTKWKLILQCDECNREYNTDLYQFMAGKQRCCESKRNKDRILRECFSKKEAELKKEISELTNDEYECLNLEDYNNQDTKLDFKHNLCGSITNIRYAKFRAGQRCGNCSSAAKSLGEIYISRVFDNLKISYIREYTNHNCFSKKGNILPFDFYIYDFNILVEVDGEHHSRPSYGQNSFQKTQENDNLRNIYAKKNDIKLIRIKYESFNENFKESVLDMLNSELKLKTSLEEMEIQGTLELYKYNNTRLEKARPRYKMLNKFWKGVDSSYTFLHLKCGNEFDAVYDQVRTSVRSCTYCHKKAREYLNWKKAKKLIEEKTENRYTLDRTYMYTRGERTNYRYIKCNGCGVSDWKLIGNILRKRGGCMCWKNKNDEIYWIEKLKEANHYLSLNKKLPYTHPLVAWIYRQKSKFNKNKLSDDQIKLIHSYKFVSAKMNIK